MQRLLSIALLTFLLVADDQLYRWLHPEVNFARAALVGATALAALLPLARIPGFPVRPAAGALAIAFSAFASVALIEAGLLVSRSVLSALVHVVFLAAAALTLDAAGRLHPARATAGIRT